MNNLPAEFKNINLKKIQPFGIMMEGIPLVYPPFRQYKQFKIAHQFTYISKKGVLVQSEEDKLTDLASVPFPFRNLLKIPGRESCGAVAHDEGYSRPFSPRFNVVTGKYELLDKNDWDDIFDDLNKMSGVSVAKRTSLNFGLNVGGWWGWRKNSRNNPNTLNVPVYPIKNLEIIK